MSPPGFRGLFPLPSEQALLFAEQKMGQLNAYILCFRTKTVCANTVFVIDAPPLLDEELVCKKICIAPQASSRIQANNLLRKNPCVSRSYAVSLLGTWLLDSRPAF